MSGRITPKLWRLIGAAALIVVTGSIVWLAFFRNSLVQETRFSSQTENLGSLLYTPDGKTLISGGDAIRLWNPTRGSLQLTLSPDDGTVNPLAIAPGGDVLACTRERRPYKQPWQYTLEFWNIKAATRIASSDGVVSTIAFSPTTPLVAVAITNNPATAAGTVQWFSLPAITPIAGASIDAQEIGGLAFSPDGKSLAMAVTGGIDMLDVSTRRSMRTLTAPPSSHCGRLAFSSDGKTLAAIIHMTAPRTSGGVSTWDLATGRPIHTIDFGHGVHDASFSADGRTLAVHLLWYGFSRNERIELWDVGRGRRTDTMTSRPPPYLWSLALAPDASRLAVGFQSPGVRKPAPIGVWRVD